jgi:hypothetical protein
LTFEINIKKNTVCCLIFFMRLFGTSSTMVNPYTSFVTCILCVVKHRLDIYEKEIHISIGLEMVQKYFSECGSRTKDWLRF